MSIYYPFPHHLYFIFICSNFGELDAMKISINLQLYEYRTMFERINAQGINELDNLMKASTQFDYCFKYFLTTQGKLVRYDNMICHSH